MITLYITARENFTGIENTPFYVRLCYSQDFNNYAGILPPTYNFSLFSSNPRLQFSTTFVTYSSYNLSSDLFIVPLLTGTNRNSIKVEVLSVKLA